MSHGRMAPGELVELVLNKQIHPGDARKQQAKMERSLKWKLQLAEENFEKAKNRIEEIQSDLDMIRDLEL